MGLLRVLELGYFTMMKYNLLKIVPPRGRKHLGFVLSYIWYAVVQPPIAAASRGLYAPRKRGVWRVER